MDEETAIAIAGAAVAAGQEPLMHLRLWKGWRVDELAQASGVAPERIACKEAGRNGLTSAEAASLAAALGVRIDLLED